MSLMNIIAQVAGGDTTRQISQQLGVDEKSAETAISGALPVLIGALARNSASTDGAKSLSKALDRDHDGSVLDDIAGFLGSGQSGSMGEAILGHVLGGRRDAVETGIGRASGLNASQVSQLMAMLAPLVMGALGREKRRNGLDASGLSDVLGRQRSAIEGQGQLGGLLGQLLDQDGDGQIMDDVANLSAGLLGKFMRSR